jgi:mono/diheme cytochrome c family protein
MRLNLTLTAFIVLAFAAAGCSKPAADDSSNSAGSATSGNASNGLTAAQLEHGIGPVTAFEVGPIDDALAAVGEELFRVKCSACHKIGERYIGPALGDVTTRRSPAFVMNMIMNPEEMVQKHPEARALLAEYVAPMANQSLTREEARAILEYLRTAAQ